MSKKKSKIERDIEKLEVEVNYTMEWLGRSTSDSKVSGDNLKKILLYLVRQKSESYDQTIYKLSIVLGMGVRYVNDYLRGLEAWNLIRTYVNGQTKVWEWVSVYEADK